MPILAFMICPKCGFLQEGGSECLHCGVIFARFHSPQAAPANKDKGESPLRTTWICFRRFYRIFRWVSLAVLVTVFILILRNSEPPAIVVAPDAPKHAEEKIQRFQSAVQHGASEKLELDQMELNGWISTNLALKKPETLQVGEKSLELLAKTATGGQQLDQIQVQQVQSSIRDVKIELLDDTLRLYAVFDAHGVDLSLELEGRIFAEDGYIRLEPAAGKLGSLPLATGTLRAASARLFDSPENKDKFRLPPEIQDIRVEHGNLVLISR
jgi:hypothetical protein